MMHGDELLKNLGPLAGLAGVWEGDKGDDVAPSDDRGTEFNKFRERITFEPFGPVNNHEQTLFGLRYATEAVRIGEVDPFHEERGYWLWDALDQQVIRSFLVPRGIAVIAGGTVQAGASSFKLKATLGSPTYGICSSVFLDREFKTMGYELEVKILSPNSFSYAEDTQIMLKGKKDLFHHRDSNTLMRVGY